MVRREMARVLAAAVTVAAAGGLTLAAEPAQAASLCVGDAGGCYPRSRRPSTRRTDGDTITIGAGTYAGGVTITKSVQLKGAGAASTIIRGGDHVLTIGAYGAARRAGGFHQRRDGHRWRGPVKPGVGSAVRQGRRLGAGGGIEIPPGAHLADGATVTISDSVITGNRANPSTSIPSGISCPGAFPQGQCPFAPANGGGIDSWGALTLIRTAVTANTAGAAPGQPGTTSDADGGGIYSRQGSLTLDHAIVSGNRATATSPAGRFAEGGGIWARRPGLRTWERLRP